MSIEILMPALSPTMEEGTLAKWSVKEGDTVESGDVLCEIETDKATMEVEAVDEGVIGKILVVDGTAGVAVNSVIAILLEEGETSDDIGSAPSEKPTPVEKTTEPAIKDDVAAVAEAPKPKSFNKGNRVFASPLARRIAADKGIDLNSISGSGPHGRIVKADVLDAKPITAPSTAAPAIAQSASADQVKAMYADGTYEEVPLDGMRKIIASRLTEAKQTIPHFYLTVDIQLDTLLAARKKLNANAEERGVKISVNDLIIKAAALALQDVPDCNAAWAGDRLLKFKASDVAVAVAIEGGLFTPIIRDAEMKSLSAISVEMKDLATRARDRKLAPHEYQGGAFAISNLGMFGIKQFDAVINPPHGSILAVGAGEKRAVIKDGQVTAATVMSVTLSVDHRVIDGALGAVFLNAIKGYLEEPVTMLV